MTGPLDRRRFLSISACAALVPGAARAATASWRGTALGAAASITLGGTGRAAADATFAAVAAELSRLEDIFSLYREDSSLSALNRNGSLDDPPADLLQVLDLSGQLHTATQGAFDPTIQPLWRALAQPGPAKSRDLRAARQRVGWDRVKVSARRIAFDRPGMAITLNGVAQGHITDRIAALLRARGFADVLVDMGEIAALGDDHGTPWTAGIAAPDGSVLRRLTLRDRGLAVSAPAGTVLGGAAHILEPRRNAVPLTRRLAAVSADSAAVADGLSTGCCLLSDADARAAVARFAHARLDLLV